MAAASSGDAHCCFEALSEERTLPLIPLAAHHRHSRNILGCTVCCVTLAVVGDSGFDGGDPACEVLENQRFDLI